jgi:phosphohistidine swiveling domain-containing protein
MQDDLVRELAQLDGGMLAQVGGKGANLGVLTRAGLPVPPGFCLTTEAYRAVASGADLESVLAALAATPAQDVRKLAELAGQARTRLLAAPVPPAVAARVASAYAALGADAPVAVRSSATAEDLPSASFAGQQDTYLNVVGADAVMQAVRRCWASLWTDRAVAYRAVQGIDHRQVRLAVVVQRMIDAQVAGVLFSANPVTGKRDQAVIDANPGLGEAVVSGAVNPDHFVVDSRTGVIRERRLGDKRLVVRPLAGGGTEQVTRTTDAEPCLSDQQIQDLAALGLRVQALYGSPQDIEWALDAAGKLWLTQARPVTTLFPLPAGAPTNPDDLRAYFCFSLAQGLNRPITPMGLAAFRLLASSVARLFGFSPKDPLAGPSRFAEAAQRVFIDMTAIVRSYLGRNLAGRVLGVMEARSAAILRRLADEPRLSIVHTPRWPLLRRVLGIAFRHRIPLRFLGAIFRPAAAREGVRRLGDELRERLFLPAGASNTRRLDHVHDILLETVPTVVPATMPAAGAGFAMLALARRLLARDLLPGELQTVLRGLAHNVTTEMDLALWALAARVRAASADLFRDQTPAELARRFRAGGLPPLLQTGLQEFLDRYGHRAVAEIDLGLPRWSEDPEHVLGVVANYLRLDPTSPNAPDAQFARASADAAAMMGTLVERARRRGRLRGWLVGLALDRARQLAGLREMPKYLMIVVLSSLRRQLAAVGAALAQARRLADPADVFFLDLVETRRGLAGEDLRARVRERRASYDQELRRRHIPRVLLSDGTEPEARSPIVAAAGVLVGTAASAGSVTAGARVVLDPVGAHLEPGEILVAPSTDPGWTPLFLTAGGLVMEMGGANSHGAVVAREYGIPAVVGVPDATAHIHTGQRVTVDGSTGTVTPI